MAAFYLQSLRAPTPRKRYRNGCPHDVQRTCVHGGALGGAGCGFAAPPSTRGGLVPSLSAGEGHEARAYMMQYLIRARHHHIRCISGCRPGVEARGGVLEGRIERGRADARAPSFRPGCARFPGPSATTEWASSMRACSPRVRDGWIVARRRRCFDACRQEVRRTWQQPAREP